MGGCGTGDGGAGCAWMRVSLLLHGEEMVVLVVWYYGSTWFSLAGLWRGGFRNLLLWWRVLGAELVCDLRCQIELVPHGGSWACCG